MSQGNIGEAQLQRSEEQQEQHSPESEGEVFVELTFEQRCNILEEAITRHPLHREIHYKTLKFCQQRRLLNEIEEHITTFPEFKQATQDQYHLICVLTNYGGLQHFELDDKGNVLGPIQKEGLTEDEIDDLVFDYAFEITEYGREIIKQHDPKARIIELLDIVPERKDTYIRVMEFCSNEPRLYKEVEELLGDQKIYVQDSQGNEQAIQPSVFLDKLEKAAGVIWNNGWILTQGGKEILDELKR